MDLKTNPRMHVHGADGLHAGVDETTNKLILYWGESKIYDDAASATRECLRSLAPLLRSDEQVSSAADRDFQLLQRHADLDSPELEAALQRFLNPDDPHFNSLEFRGLGLVGFDSEAYPADSVTIELEAIVSKVSESLPGWKEQIERRVRAERLDEFGVHFILVPFPSAENFRKMMLLELGLGEVK
jgi:hypothetical protein